VHTYGQEKLELNNYIKYLEGARAQAKKFALKKAISTSMIFLVFFGFYGYTFYFGGWLRWTEKQNRGDVYKAGTIITCMFSVIIATFHLGGIAPHLSAIKEGQVAGKMAQDTMNAHVIVNPNLKNKKKVTDVTGKIEFRDVVFKYPTRPDLTVLKNFNCVFEAGKTTALVGPSGSGKSTIIQLIERFYQQNQGTVLLDGEPIQEYDLRNLRQNIGYIGQEAVLFNTTIRENMHFAKPGATDEEIEYALK
jgi:ATP-binding cassette subfamily B (MDR/TAP) protein 1